MIESKSAKEMRREKIKDWIQIIIEFLLIVAFLASLAITDDPVYVFFGLGEISESWSFLLPFLLFIFALITGFGALFYIFSKRVNKVPETLTSLLGVLDLTFGTLAMVNIFFSEFTFGVFTIIISMYLLFVVFYFMLRQNRFMIYLMYFIMGLGIVYFILLGINYTISFVDVQITEPFTGLVIVIVLPVFFIWLTIDPIEFIKKEEKKKKEKKTK